MAAIVPEQSGAGASSCARHAAPEWTTCSDFSNRTTVLFLRYTCPQRMRTPAHAPFQLETQ
jgi:hypothetical protein